MSDQIILGTRKGTLIIDRRQGGWQPRAMAHSGVSVCYAAPDPRDGTIWASLDHGHWGPKLSRSRDGGETWADAPSISYPEGARMIAQYLPVPGEDSEAVARRPKYKAAKLLKTWVLAFAGADQPGVMHAGTIPGGLFTTTDGGENWQLNRALWNHESRGGDLFAGEATSKNEWGGTPAAIDYGEFAPGIHSIVIDPRDAARMLVAVSTAGVVETSDGGESWVGRNRGLTNDFTPGPAPAWGHDPHFITVCPAQPDCVWQQNHCGVFRSKDGAREWSKVSDPERNVHFGFPIVADEEEGERAWVVPGRSDSERIAVGGGLFVARTDDGGATWREQRSGLPQNHAYDVIYRHALDISGQRLCFGTTTGNVYISEDGGENWQCIGGNFPPVYSVRFGQK